MGLSVRIGWFLIATLHTGLCISGCGGGGKRGTTTAPITSSSTAPTGSSSTAPTASATTPGATGQPLATGTLRVLTYNVAGLPQGLSKASPATNTVLISPRLNTYDLVVAQEDFWYHTDLASAAQHPFQSLPGSPRGTLVNDGLNRFSRSPFSDFDRQTWTRCHGLFSAGADCLAAKGFSVARHDLAPGVTIDVYNLHADAGGDTGDIDARVAQFAQLSQFMQAYSSTHAVIVAGDTNLKGAKRPRDDQTLLDFLGAQGLQDSARVLGAKEDIDRIMFRSSADVELIPLRWREADEFVDANGQDLSDHEANNVDFEWRRWR
jgi:hypothetical protein